MQVAINGQLVSFEHSYRNAGISRYIYNLLEGLAAIPSDQEYTVFVSGEQAANAASSQFGASSHMRIAAAPRGTSRPMRRIAWEQATLPSALSRLGADVFHAPANILPSGLRCASVVTVHDLAFLRYPEFFRPSRRLYQRWFTARSVRRASRIVAVSESTRQDLIELLHVPEERIDVIYPGIPADFRPIEDEQQINAFRERHHLPARYLLFLGTLEPRKNLTTLLEAYAALRAADPDAPALVIAGAKGWYYDTLFARVHTLKLEQAVTFAGYVTREEQPLWYAGAEVFIYPSWYEGFGIPVAEALACGTPTITSNVSSLPEAAGPVALQVAPGDAEGLARAMHRVLNDTATRRQMRVEGPRWAETFSIARMAERYVTAYTRADGANRDSRGKRRG